MAFSEHIQRGQLIFSLVRLLSNSVNDSPYFPLIIICDVLPIDLSYLQKAFEGLIFVIILDSPAGRLRNEEINWQN